MEHGIAQAGRGGGRRSAPENCARGAKCDGRGRGAGRRAHHGCGELEAMGESRERGDVRVRRRESSRERVDLESEIALAADKKTSRAAAALCATAEFDAALRHHASIRPRRRERDAPSRVAVVGGGLAGLATAFHLLNASAPLDALHVRRARAGDGRRVGGGGGPPPSVHANGRRNLARPRRLRGDVHAAPRVRGARVIAVLHRVGPAAARARRREHDGAGIGGERGSRRRRDAAGVALARRTRRPAPAPRWAASWAAPPAPAALSVDTPAYLRALWALCEAEAAAAGADCRWIERRLGAAELRTAEAAPYDAIVVATGARVRAGRAARSLRDTVTKVPRAESAARE